MSKKLSNKIQAYARKLHKNAAYANTLYILEVSLHHMFKEKFFNHINDCNQLISSLNKLDQKSYPKAPLLVKTRENKLNISNYNDSIITLLTTIYYIKLYLKRYNIDITDLDLESSYTINLLYSALDAYNPQKLTDSVALNNKWKIYKVFLQSDLI